MPLPRTSYNLKTPLARILDGFHPEQHCVASGKLELNAKQYSKSCGTKCQYRNNNNDTQNQNYNQFSYLLL
jgi:hypothetical protein